MKTTIAAALLLLCCSCTPDATTPEAEPPRVTESPVKRITITKESTLAGFPDVYLIRDDETGTELIALKTSEKGALAMAILGTKPKPAK